MAKKQTKSATAAIEELIEVTLRTRKDAKRAKELRKEAQKEALALYKAKQWEVGKDMPFGEANIRLYKEKVCHWVRYANLKQTDRTTK